MKSLHKTIEIGKISEFVAHLEELRDGHRAFFRGQAIDKPLLPAVAREVRTINHTGSEIAYLKEFRRRAASLLDVNSYDDWRLLTIAQHSGSTTRLLDWSRNPLAALWFAVSTSSGGGDSKSVVWQVMLDESDYVTDEDLKKSPFALRRTKFFLPDHISPRVLAQESCFSVHRYWESRQGGRYAALETQKEFQGKLTKFVIRQGREEDLYIKLDRLGLNFANLMPDLDGLSRYMASRYKFAVRGASLRRMIYTISSDLQSKKNQ